MEIEDDISGAGLCVEGEWKGDVVDCMLELVFVFALGVDDLVVICEPGRTDEHVAVLFDAAGGDVFFDLVGFGLCFRLTFLHTNKVLL